MISLTGIREIDNNIILFCDWEIIGDLISLNKQLVEQAIIEIIKSNLDDPEELAGFTIDLIDMNKIRLAKKFIENTIIVFDNKIKEPEDFWEYYKAILRTYLREDILELYFTTNCNFDKIIEYFRDDLNSRFWLTLVYGDYTEWICDSIYILDDWLIFYQAAINAENIVIIKFMLDYYHNTLPNYINDIITHENYTEIKGYFDELEELNVIAKDIIDADFRI
jgi:hypothetical protein